MKVIDPIVAYLDPQHWGDNDRIRGHDVEESRSVGEQLPRTGRTSHGQGKQSTSSNVEILWNDTSEIYARAEAVLQRVQDQLRSQKTKTGKESGCS
ncbi:uncharacterized protein RCC_09414 [Ramularia collo-cygni]|uniref:Uncharacterized protein n=1 Tax=Ramularia collo-cygni TaxID=112498 RepID=A0A2D3VHJ7_9PEZI|nr:uncharacterized protein RCC_09414 [Ramularia collo-cygni]CZT23701.1 uncharacterized protein RCC_09414 [Ramularia collo-cygni]